jgi:ElaB/YqjD/DUF883 family membrane-anchored ribosome-binding protein
MIETQTNQQPRETKMMDKTADQLDRARGRMAGDFKTVISGIEEQLKSAKASLAEASQPLLDKTREGAAAANDYVRANPWSAVGFGIAAGVLIGFLAAKR